MGRVKKITSPVGAAPTGAPLAQSDEWKSTGLNFLAFDICGTKKRSVVDCLLDMNSNPQPAVYRLHTRHRPRLLLAMMRELAGEETLISLEGRLLQTDLMHIEGVSFDETEVLRRGTIAPKLDFLVLALTLQTLPRIEKAIVSRISFHSTEGIVHVQIESHGTIAFAAYDNFDENCTTVAYTAISIDVLEQLVQGRVLRSYSTE